MAVNFPASPAVNDTHTSGATTWRWDGTRWGKVTDGAAGGVLSGTYPNPSFASDMATQAELDAAIATREPSITAGTASQYWRGNKTWADFFTDVRASTLTGLSTATNAVITAADTVLTALGNLQKQVSDNLTTLTGHTGAASGAHAATAISNTPAGNIAATTVQAAINELDTEKVAKSGDTMTGNLTVPSLNEGQLAGLRNKIINGNYGINQRAYVSGAATTAGQYTLDRWKVTGTGGVTFSTTANKTTVTIPSGQTLQQVVEGLSLESGTYVLSWEGTAQGRIAGGSYGASGAVTASITGGTNTTIEFNTGTVALVMLEKGTVATPFEHRPYGTELALARRYYYRVKPGKANDIIAESGIAAAGNVATLFTIFPQPMRVIPTALEQSGTATDYRIYSAAGATTCNDVPVYNTASEKAANTLFVVAGGLTTGQANLGFSGSANGYLGWSAEL